MPDALRPKLRKAAENRGPFQQRNPQLSRTATAILSRPLRRIQSNFHTDYYYHYKRTRAVLKEETKWS